MCKVQAIATTIPELADGVRRSSTGREAPVEASELQVLQQDGIKAAVKEKTLLADSEAVTTARRCPLCLSNRVVSTAARCGHVFCWTCIVQWCQQKKECPICRAATGLQDLVPLAHFDP
jgi:peroxin-10